MASPSSRSRLRVSWRIQNATNAVVDLDRQDPSDDALSLLATWIGVMTRPAACLPAELARAHLRTIRPRDLAADDARNQQIADDVIQALKRGRHCLVLTQRTAHLELLAGMLHNRGHDPAVLRGGMGANARTTAVARFNAGTPERPLVVVATGSYIGEGFDCPALDTFVPHHTDRVQGSLSAIRGPRPAPLLQ